MKYTIEVDQEFEIGEKVRLIGSNNLAVVVDAIFTRKCKNREYTPKNPQQFFRYTLISEDGIEFEEIAPYMSKV